MVTVLYAAQVPPRLPLLEAGDHLDQATFHARYKAMPKLRQIKLSVFSFYQNISSQPLAVSI